MDESHQNFNIKDYFVYQKIMLRIVGLSLRANETVLYKIYVVFIRLFFVVYFLVLITDIASNNDDVDVIIDSIYHELGFTLVLATVWVVSNNGKKLGETLDVLQSGIFAPNRERGGPLEEILIKKCVISSNRQIVVSCFLAIVGIFTSIINCIVKRILNHKNNKYWELPFGKFSMFRTHLSPNFELAWLFQSVMFPIAAVSYLATVFLVVAVFSHICVQFKMLRNSIRGITNCGSQEMVTVENYSASDALSEVRNELLRTCWKYLFKKLQAHVRYHKAIIDLASQFEEILNRFVLINYLAVMLALGCIMYHASLYPVWDPRFQKDAMIGVAWSFQLFLISYWGNEVILESQMLVNACYDVDFVGTDLKFQKDLCLVMTRGQKAIIFTVGKFQTLSLASFIAVLRASVSYYMVLRSTYLNK